jgi:hypothetical protein
MKPDTAYALAEAQGAQRLIICRSDFSRELSLFATKVAPCISLDMLISYRRIRWYGELVSLLRLQACVVDEAPYRNIYEYL